MPGLSRAAVFPGRALRWGFDWVPCQMIRHGHGCEEDRIRAPLYERDKGT